MDKTIAGLLGAAAALTTMSTANATPVEAAAPPAATSYADLLQPVPNALALQKADDARRTETPAGVQLAQVVIVGHHHHHHHHHHARDLRVGPVVIERRHRHHHHHHHHHSDYR